MENLYNNMTDEELLVLYKDGDTKIVDFIMNRYKNLVKNKAKSMYILGADNDDLIQEGMIGLFKAVRDFDVGRDASFQTFALLCVSRQMYTAIETSRRKKHMPLNSYISLYANRGIGENGEELENFNLNNVLIAHGGNGPEESLIAKESLEQLEDLIDQELSTFEKQVFDLHLTGMGYLEIAKVLGKDAKATDNALQRIRTKIKKIINEKVVG